MSSPVLDLELGWQEAADPAVRAPAIAERDSRSLTGAVRPLLEPDGLVEQFVADVSGFGPLHELLDDDTVEEVWINAPAQTRYRLFVNETHRVETDGSGKSFLVYLQVNGEDARIPLP